MAQSSGTPVHQLEQSARVARPVAVAEQTSCRSGFIPLDVWEELAMMTRDALHDCTAEERRYFLACQRNLMSFELSLVQDILRGIERSIHARFKNDAGTLLVRHERDKVFDDFRRKNSLRDIELQLLDRMQRVLDLQWHLEVDDTDATWSPGTGIAANKNQPIGEIGSVDKSNGNGTGTRERCCCDGGWAPTNSTWQLPVPSRVFSRWSKSTEQTQDEDLVSASPLFDTAVGRGSSSSSDATNKRQSSLADTNVKVPKTATSGSVQALLRPQPWDIGPVSDTANSSQTLLHQDSWAETQDLYRRAIAPAKEEPLSVLSQALRSSTTSGSGHESLSFDEESDREKIHASTSNSGTARLADGGDEDSAIHVTGFGESHFHVPVAVGNTPGASLPPEPSREDRQSQKPSSKANFTWSNCVQSGPAAPSDASDQGHSADYTNNALSRNVLRRPHVDAALSFATSHELHVTGTGPPLIDLGSEQKMHSSVHEDASNATRTSPQTLDQSFGPSHPNDLTPISKFANRVKTDSHNNTSRPTLPVAEPPQVVFAHGSPVPPPLYGPQASHHSVPIRPIFSEAPFPAAQVRMQPNRSIPNQDSGGRAFHNELARRAVMSNGSGWLDYVPKFFQYGIQYLPNARAATADLEYQQRDFQCSSVVIAGLPDGAQLRDVMPRVRGGKILQATLVDTRALQMGRTAYVVFSKSEEAQAYVGYAKSHPSDMTVLGCQASVELTGTPTYPREGLRDMDRTETRCLEWGLRSRQLCEKLLECIEVMFQHAEDALEDMWYDKAKSILMLFKNVDYAARFDEFLRAERKHLDWTRGLQFVQDPCAGPLGSLATPAGLARGGNESILEAWMARRGPAGSGQFFSPIPLPQNTESGSDSHAYLSRHGEGPLLPMVNDNLSLRVSPTTATTRGKTSHTRAGRPNIASLAQTVPENSCSLEDANIYAEKEDPCKQYSLEEFKNKYGFQDFIANPDKWREKHRNVGETRTLTPPPQVVDDGVQMSR